MDRILFGDNQFFGVNHMSEQKAQAQAMRFRTTQDIIDVLDIAYDMGIKTFMCTTHDTIGEVCDYMRANPERYKDFVYYPCMPYAHKYANAVSEVGILGTLRRYAPGGIVNTMMQGAIAGAKMDVEGLMKMLVDAEMQRFHGLNTPVVFLQNVVTDLLLGFDFREMFAAFAKHIEKKYNAEAAFITMNMPRLLDVLESVGIENPIICSNINKIGFRMCGGVELYEKTIREREFRPIAMSVFASGAILPEEAISYVCDQENIQSIVFGASSKTHIRQSKELIERLSSDSSREESKRRAVLHKSAGPAMKLCIVVSSGGHIFEMFCLRDFWQDKDRFWVTFQTSDAEFLLHDEKRVYWAAHPTVRSVKNLGKNTLLAWKILRQERPDMIITTGSGVAAPFMWLGKALGIPCVFIESITRISELSMTGRIVSPFVTHLLVQWEELEVQLDKAEFYGRVV